MAFLASLERVLNVVCRGVLGGCWFLAFCQSHSLGVLVDKEQILSSAH